MIEKIILDYLNLKLQVPCYMEGPEKRPRSYTVISKVGSGEKNHIRDATITVESYAPSLYETALLNEEVKTAMSESISLPSISRCELNSDYNYTDTSSKEYCYQAVFDIIYL